MTDTAARFIGPRTPEPVTPEAPLQVLVAALSDGIPIPRMTVIWNPGDYDPSLSMMSMTPPEFDAWVTWLDATTRVHQGRLYAEAESRGVLITMSSTAAVSEVA